MTTEVILECGACGDNGIEWKDNYCAECGALLDWESTRLYSIKSAPRAEVGAEVTA